MNKGNIITYLLQFIKTLQEKILSLSNNLSNVSKALDEAIDQNINFDLTIQQLKAENEQLKALIQNKSVPLNSQNSNLPPSSDIAPKKKKNTSLRPKSSNKKGGQKGHKGHHLKKVEQPDQIIHLKPKHCYHCGADLDDREHRIVADRQEIFLPQIQPKHRAFVQYECKCTCGKIHIAPFPDHIKAPIQYGRDIMAINAYLNAYQFLPFHRTQQFFADICNLKISQATLAKQIQQFHQCAKGAYEHIRQFIQHSDVVGSDETSAKVNGHKHWFWTFQNHLATFIFYHASRGFKAILEYFPHQFPDAIYVSDQFNAQLKVKARIHQICWAHLLRHLNRLIQIDDQYWPKQIKELFYLADQLKKQHGQLQKNDPRAIQIENRINQLLIYQIDPKHKDSIKFQNSLKNSRDRLFPFLYHEKVPPDNNASERAIRNIKVKSKVSGQFIAGQQAYCVIRSIIDTCIKGGHNIIDNLTNIATKQQLLFKLT